ncbi:M15 family metallopeptidase [Pseudoalteromonas umbrosa]|uniref:M15 family metallopeptidase n=1 Tax=Pseudoalteromonas umbrosa TaxID=3048489 RepID=UPI0024C3CA25|nr:M15 family metallopeptidase [Pseudoalteromonas sp. B95]MDK1286692.1 M15 family metallopeptidase [Pseudoalteromonas sp. B95]
MNNVALQALGLDLSHLVEYQDKFVHKEVIKDLDALNKAAKAAGFAFSIASAHRDFQRQAIIWNAKFSGKRPILDKNNSPVDITSLSDEKIVEAIMLFSALPGTSRHHFGSDLDVYASNCLGSGESLQLEPWEYQSGGPFDEFSCWLDASMPLFGFFKPYDTYRGGVAAEPWHISHLETAHILEKHVSLNTIEQVITERDVLGKEAILANLPKLYSQFITNIAKG